jgi:hypothetical protein
MKNNFVLGLLAAVLFGFFSGPDVSALNLNDLAGPEQAAALIAGEKPVLAQFKNPKPSLAPRHDILAVFLEAVREELNPSVMVETLHLYKKPAHAAKNVWSAGEETGLYNAVLGLSTLAGLQYYSASRETMRTFYETSGVIDGPSAKNPLPDPVYPQPRPELSVYARQKDLTFGDNIYQYDYYSVPGAIIFMQQNLTTMTAGIIPAVGKNKLRSTVAIFDAEDYLLVYAASMAKAVSIPGMNERVGNSFSNRAVAILNWFSAQADKVFTAVHSQ